MTSAALILVLSFVAMTATPQTDVKILATGLAAGILVDATIGRCLLVPALVALFGRYNWWLPRWMATILRVEPSPLPAKPRRLTRPTPPSSARRHRRRLTPRNLQKPPTPIVTGSGAV